MLLNLKDLKVIYLLLILEDSLEPRMVLYLKVTWSSYPWRWSFSRMEMYLKVTGLLPDFEDGLEPRMLLNLKFIDLPLILEDGLEPRMILYLQITGLLLPGLEDGL
jgi:hypothetical protein